MIEHGNKIAVRGDRHHQQQFVILGAQLITFRRANPFHGNITVYVLNMLRVKDGNMMKFDPLLRFNGVNHRTRASHVWVKELDVFPFLPDTVKLRVRRKRCRPLFIQFQIRQHLPHFLRCRVDFNMIIQCQHTLASLLV
ncbi:hypothetical protein [Vibrio vulnificus YJ016]|uniref:Uncharacterized protein n=1 Tax=Vibrio vulnificus (strain YJ016) TaxID=196600 RepID=Q7MFN3_VIBVY|nr:hypothetical protein [Vibrio vulnificus YJ016]